MEKLLLVIASAFLGLTIGAWLTWKDSFPFNPLLRNGFLAADAFRAVYLDRRGLRETDIWVTSGDQRAGVLHADPGKMAPGLTLIAVGQSAHLVDPDGNIKHSWHLPYARLMGSGTLITSEPPETQLFWRPVRVFPDGSLLALVDQVQRTPAGLALMKLDRDSKIIWVHHGNVHHDFDVGADGRIYVLAQTVRAAPPQALTALRGPLLDERLQILSSDGALLRDISLIEAFANSRYSPLLERVAPEHYSKGDYLHANNVDVVTEDVAARFPFARAGNILLSFREISTLALLDLKQSTIVWARRGPWFHQHDPEFLDNGNLLLFDNQGDWERGGRTRVIEYDPATEAIVWRYPRDEAASLWSRERGDAQKLSNGNVLINEFMQGRLHEVTPAGEAVWLYRCPYRHPADRNLKCNILWAERYSTQNLDFLFNGGKEVYTKW